MPSGARCSSEHPPCSLPAPWIIFKRLIFRPLAARAHFHQARLEFPGLPLHRGSATREASTPLATPRGDPSMTAASSSSRRDGSPPWPRKFAMNSMPALRAAPEDTPRRMRSLAVPAALREASRPRERESGPRAAARKGRIHHQHAGTPLYRPASTGSNSHGSTTELNFVYTNFATGRLLLVMPRACSKPASRSACSD